MGRGPTQFFSGHNLVGDRFDNIRACDEHVAAVFDHEDKVGHGRRINGTTGTGAHDDADLGHHTRGHDVALEYLGITRKRVDAFLNARSA